MRKFKDSLYLKAPHLFQNIMISLFNIIAYNKRYSGNYWKYRFEYQQNNSLSFSQLVELQKIKYSTFISYVQKNSIYYQQVFDTVSESQAIENIEKIEALPIIDKEILRKNIESIYTLKKSEGSLSKTGGTTGKSLEVLYTYDDIQQRFAILDNFRSGFGYELGKKTAWFSGKNLLTEKDLRKKRFWKTDYWYNVRYYSTFHIHSKYLGDYLQNLIQYQPEYMVGFPSTMYEIAKFGLANHIDFPVKTIKAIFPTAETITKEIREVLESFFKTNVYNQYASSEGAPFILECKNKKLHLELQSGVFEVLDENNHPSNRGRLVVTSFNTHGTPLIRYDIGDEIELLNGECSCGNKNPLVNSILGRVSDFIFSEEMGKINLGNISNCLKGVHGIVKFQIQQDTTNQIKILIVKDNQSFTKTDEMVFTENLRDRLGTKMGIQLLYVKEIPVEKSGKYRLVKNSLKF